LLSPETNLLIGDVGLFETIKIHPFWFFKYSRIREPTYISSRLSLKNNQNQITISPNPKELIVFVKELKKNKSFYG
jgi:hypothetical protein